ncbi:protein phosphatase Slingshot homolog 1-like isoform X3 [Mya arenaria]|uniref:protein phosphatase Slingshot homolog 1-like isoform X3 n=1 Tax=Mya arenaria TaxID=6604 RepID=UPI0022E806D7|nr:protein phosphatase Slingshot homolog 1-like isoform X3 [Mya arenaria]
MLADRYLLDEEQWRTMVGDVYSCYGNQRCRQDFRKNKCCVHVWSYYKDLRSSRSALKKLRKLFNTVRFVTKLKPCFSESYFAVKGAALILPQNDETVYTRRHNKNHAGDDIQMHLQAMFSLLRPSDTIKVAVKLEGEHTRYLAVVSCIGRQDTEESVILGIDILEQASVGLILPVWAHTEISLDGDGGFTIKIENNTHAFKPVSVQAMWSALQSLNKVVKIAKDMLYIPRGLTHTWVGYYEGLLSKESYLVSEWTACKDRDLSYRADPKLRTEFSGEEDIYRVIKHELKNVMMEVDLEEVTCIFLRKAVEAKLGRDLKEYRSFIDAQMMEILGQMDAPSKILDHLYLGSEWNASNLEDLQNNGVQHILNISREIDNFFPGILHYMNVREWDNEQADLMKYWEHTHRFINKARKRGSKALVHCKMGISRSGSTVIAYLMKEKRMSLEEAFNFTKSKRSIVNPNNAFMAQLETYQGILNANWNKEKFENQVIPRPLAKLAEEEIPPVECFQSPEDLLEYKLGKDLAEGGDLPYLHTEHDIDIASRSADSTEDSHEDQLSPKSADDHGSKKFKYRKSDAEKMESGDLNDSSDTDSESTESEEFSFGEDFKCEDDVMVDDDEKDGASGFKPIDLPDVLIDAVEERMKPRVVDSRRCKSEGDKGTLAVIENMDGGFSREGSVSKFRADGSWIKPPSKDDMIDDNGEVIEFNEGVDEDTNDNVADRSEGIWIGDKSVDKEPEPNENKNADSMDMDERDMSQGDVRQDPYTKENISWEAGSVIKQKKDIETKYGSGTVTSVKKPDTSSPSIEISGEPEKNTQNLVKSSSNPEITVENESELFKLESHDLSGQSEGSSGAVSQSESRDDGEGRKSVYEVEEIDLPEGIVRKTRLEIEEKHRLSLESPRTKLKRSSSLKSNRVTPKARDRDNERRKTCIALLSPTHPDYTGHGQSGLLSPTSWSLGASSAPCQAGARMHSSDDSDEDENQSGSVKVYKFMGEEVTVQEGMVKKQKQDIEKKGSHQLQTADTSPSSRDRILLKSESVSDFRHVQPEQTDSSSKIDKCTKYSPVSFRREKSSSISESNDSQYSGERFDHNLNSRSNSFSRKDSFTSKDSFGCSPPSGSSYPLNNVTPPRKQSVTKQKSRFDPETLALIREIGSALLNSPAKAELEDDDDVDLKEGESLVSHYVKKIEKTSKVTPRKSKREIIIIDKIDSGSEKGKSQLASRTSPVSKKHDTDEVPSKWSPLSKRPSFSTISPEGKRSQTTKECDNYTQSPVRNKTENNICVNKFQNVSDTHHEESIMSLNLQQSDLSDSSSNKATHDDNSDSSEVCSVKDLCGKFEIPDPGALKVSPIVSPSGISPVFSGAKLDLKGVEIKSSSPHLPLLTSEGHDSVKGQGQIGTILPLLKRQTEPSIHLSDRSMKMFESKWRDIGENVVICKHDTSPVREESDDLDYDNKGHHNEGQGYKTSNNLRPKSSQPSANRGHRSLGSATGQKFYKQSLSMHESGMGEQDSQFTWEGKKVRKSYGKSHPLAKLENRQSEARKNPFYNTM